MTRRTTARVLVASAVTGTVVLANAAPALASWTAASSAARGYTAATTMPSGNTPTGSAIGSTVTVSWAQSLITAGIGVSGYRVKRYDTATGVAQAVLADCAGTLAGTSCTENGVPDGTWTYTVMPVQGNWTGTESARSTSVTVSSIAASTGITFPVNGKAYSTSTYNAGCGTTTAGDFCGTATAAGGGTLAGVQVSVRRGTGNYWDPATSGFTSATEKLFSVSSGTANWTVSFPATNFTADGQYTLHAVSTDTQGLSSSATSIFTIMQTPPPTPSITGTPANPTNQTNATFAFTDSQSGVTFQCKLDSGSFGACTSPVTYSGLAQGSHTFAVQAVDAAGNTSPATGSIWTVDTTAPTATDVQATNDSGLTVGKMESGDKLTFSYSEQVSPSSIKTGWNGSSISININVANGNGNGNSADKITFTDTANAAIAALGTVNLRQGDYVNADTTFTATMVQSGTQIVITLTSNPPAATTSTNAGDMQWMPGSGTTDLAGNALVSGQITEQRPGTLADKEF